MMSFPAENRRVLILALSGIGNFLMQRPFLKALKENRPDWDLTVWITPRGVKPLVEITPQISEWQERRLPQGVAAILRQGWKLNRQSFNQAIMLSPGQLWKGALLMTLAGAENRLAHHYPHLGNQASSFLLTESIPERDGLHDIEQNLNLLQALDIDPTPYLNQPYTLELPVEFITRAQNLIPAHSATQPLFGLHPGSSLTFTWKRWPLEFFADLGRGLQKKFNASLLIFGDKSELKQQKELKKMIGGKTTIISGDLLTTAGVISKCTAFVSNDSGLMHLAAALGIRTYGLFGPTNEVETGPRGIDSQVMRAPGTKPVYETEQGDDLGQGTHSSLKALKPDYVLERVEVRANNSR